VAAGLIVGALYVASSQQASANPVSGFEQIDGGLYHTCAVTTAGGVKCWGVALDSDIIGFVDFGRTPVDVAGLTSGVSSVASGLYHTCAVTTSSQVKCFGRHYGTNPIVVSAFGSDVVSISAGWDYTCALKAAGGIACFFTDGTSIASTGLTSGIAEVAASTGFHTCVRMNDGTVKCWGFNEHGQVGDGTTIPRPTAVQVAGLTNVTQIGLGVFYSCALTSSGGVKCWGDGFGLTPTDVAGMTSGIAEISVSVEHLCARTTAGGVLCRGSNRYGQLGDNRECGMTCLTPVVPAGLANGVAAVNAGHEHTCAILVSTEAKCWGFNGLGSAGDASHTVRQLVPVYVAESTQKPTPTATPCPPSGCPSPTPTPTRPSTVLDFAIGIDTNGNGVDECRTSGFFSPTCNMQTGTVFDVKVYLNGYPEQFNDYDGFAATVKTTGPYVKGSYSVSWPECIFDVFAQGQDFFNFGCVSFGGLTSIYLGPLGRAGFTCTQSGQLSLVHGLSDTVLGSDGVYVSEPPENVDQLTVNCGNFPATPTSIPTQSAPPTPAAVGGIGVESGARQAAPAWLLGFAMVGMFGAALFAAWGRRV
jgi:alpha-tubulin suppressor-like RCC1 family protein